MAKAIPSMPYALPRFAVSCLESPPKLRMKSTPLSKYEAVIRVWDMARSWAGGRSREVGAAGSASAVASTKATPARRRLPGEHLEHALRDQEATGNVDGGDQDRNGAEDGDGTLERARDLEHAAHDDDAADRVGDAHERRVQSRRHVPHDLPADEHAEHEHRQVCHECRRRHGAETEQRSGHGQENQERTRALLLGFLLRGGSRRSGLHHGRLRFDRMRRGRWWPGDGAGMRYERAADHLVFQ